MVEISSPLSRENRIQISRSSAISGFGGERSFLLSDTSAQKSGPDPETLKILEANQSTLNILSSGINSLRQRIDFLTGSLGSLSNIITNDNILESIRENQRRDQERRLAEQALRDESESAIEKKIQSSLTTEVRGVAEKTTSKLNSLMGIFTKLFSGWLGYKGISSIQSQITGNNKRLFQVKDVITNSLSSIRGAFLGIKNGFDDIVGKVAKLSNKITKSVTEGLIINPFKALFPSKEPPSIKPPTRTAAEAGTEAATRTAAEAGTEAATRTAAEAGTEAATRTGGKGLSRLLPFANIPISAAFAYQNIKQGDPIGAGFDLGGMIPGPLGWASLGGGAAYEFLTKGGIKGIPNVFEPTQPKPQKPQQTSSNIESTKPNLIASLPEQTPIIDPQKIQQSEKQAEDVTPTGNIAFNFGDQISNINNNILSSSKSEDQTLAMNMSSVLDMKESPKTEDYSISNSNQYTQEFIDKAQISPIEKPTVENVIKRDISVGPLPTVQPNIIITPIPQAQKSSPSRRGSSGVGNDVPAIPSSNADNFYALYSKVHYNIV
jgi:hypothetical protein